jgi:hypothetical protein
MGSRLELKRSILGACGRVMTTIVQRRCSRDKSRFLAAEQIRRRPRS